MIKDLTQGRPTKVLLMFSIPMLLSMVFQQMYNIADSVIVGQFNGKDALAAVGASYPITMLFIAIAMGASVGSSVIISQLFGLKSLERMKTAVWTAVISILALSVLLTLVGYIISAPLIKLLKTPEDIFTDSLAYLNIYIGGLIFLFLYNAATSIFNGLGDSRTPLIFLIISSVFNVVLDLIFVGVLHMGVVGAAWATFIAQGLSGAAAIITLLFKVSKIKTINKYKKFDLGTLKKISMVAIPSILQQSFVSVGQLCVQGAVNSFGTNTMAAYSSAMKINIFAVSIFNTMSSALSSYTAQNMGAGNENRIKKGYPAALKIAFSISAALILLWFVYGKYLIGFFVNKGDGEQVIDIGYMFLQFVAIGYPIVALKVVTDGLLRGAGYMTGFMISTFADLIVRVGVSLIFAGSLGFTAICISFPIGWIVGCAISLFFYFSGKWKNKVKV